MEILVTDKLMGTFVFMILLSSVIGLLFLALTIYCFVETIKDFEWNGVFATLFCLVVASISILVFVVNIYIGVPVQYKAKITDFNEVYNNGYEVVGEEGELYILEKKF